MHGGVRLQQHDGVACGVDHFFLHSLVTSRDTNGKQHIQDAPTVSFTCCLEICHYAVCPVWLTSVLCFPNTHDVTCRVQVANSMITKPPAMMLAQTGEQRPLNSVQGRATHSTGEQRPLNSVQGSATPSDKFMSSSLKEQNTTATVAPPAVIRNPYKKIQRKTPNITHFCKPIYTPRSTVRNPYARDSKLEVHSQLVS